MTAPATLQYRVLVSKGPETGSTVAEIPALQIADFGVDVPEALDRLQAMLAFHLECLLEEGKPIPSDLFARYPLKSALGLAREEVRQPPGGSRDQKEPPEDSRG